MSLDGSDSVKKELERIRKQFDQIIADFEPLKSLSADKFKVSTYTDGFVINASKNSETIIVYVCNKSGIKVSPPPHPSTRKDIVFSDYIFHASKNKIISNRVKNQFDYIRDIRNACAHINEFEETNLEHEELSLSKAIGVEESLFLVMDWFFHTYLNEQYPDLSLKKRVVDENTPYLKYIPEAVISEKMDEVIMLNGNQNASTKQRKKSKRWMFILVLFALLVAGFCIYSYTDLIIDHQPVSLNYIPTVHSSAIPISTSNPSVLTEKQKKSEKELKETVKNFLDNYYTSIAEDTFDAKNYFSEDVKEYQSIIDDQVIPVCGIAEINSRLKDLKDFYNPDFVFHADNLELLNKTDDEETIWQYKGQYSEFKANSKYRPSKKVLIRFTLDSENKKFVSLRETVEDGNAGGS